ncbi:MAG: hypothetical protein K6G83_16285 [Lachnospiraceae bacterium]|nr:hypothetical protein [Lachnospiraceae bacterium]
MGRTYNRCPRCGSSNTATFIDRYPFHDDEMKQKLNSGKVVLGECRYPAVSVEGAIVPLGPTKRCNACKKDFATPPILIDSKTGVAEDYRDIVTSVILSVGGFRGGWTEISVKKNKSGAMVCVSVMGPAVSEEDMMPDRQISAKEWKRLVDTLYGKMNLHEWKKKYVIPGVLEGTQWKLEIKMTKGRKRTYLGDNDYPPYWRALLKVFEEISGYAKL